MKPAMFSAGSNNTAVKPENAKPVEAPALVGRTVLMGMSDVVAGPSGVVVLRELHRLSSQ